MSEHKWKATDKDGKTHIYKVKPYADESYAEWMRQAADNEVDAFRLVDNAESKCENWAASLVYCEHGFDAETGEPLSSERSEIMKDDIKQPNVGIVQTIKELIGDYPFTIEYDNSSGSKVYVKLCDAITFTVKDDTELNELLPALKQACKYLGTL